MLNDKGFNLWADQYDETVEISNETDAYPFAGYKRILGQIYNEVMAKHPARVLDIGFGTAVLSSKLYSQGHWIDGIDFSSKMRDIAQEKMPNARLIEWDIESGLPEQIREEGYDAIISTYTLHHLSDERKVTFVRQLLQSLAEGGKLLIGDVAFESRQDLEACRQKYADVWDEDEYYFVADELRSSLKGFSTTNFYPMSHCGGIFVISK